MDQENYDLNAYYLYENSCYHKIGKIEKINDKTIRMDNGYKILKEDFEKVHKLTEE